MAQRDKILELILQTRLKGGEEIKAGAESARKFTEEEEKTAAALRKTLGPYDAAIKAQRDLNAARDLGLGGKFLKDIEYRASQSQKRIERIEKAKDASTPGGAMAQAFLSSRFGGGGSGGGLMPLVGQTIKAVGGDAALDAVTGVISKVGPWGASIAAATQVAVKVAQALISLAIESAAVTQRFSDLRTQVGGNSVDAGRAQVLSRITGVDAGSASRSFNDRITSDPLAMGIASRFGIYNTPGPYGKRNFGEQYAQAVERVSNIHDEFLRARMAQMLGIEQEVSRYSKLNPEAKDRMKRFALTTARVNNPEMERRAALLQAAVANAAQARENLKTAFGQLFEGGTTSLINFWAGIENGLANDLVDFNHFVDKFRIGGDRTPQNNLDKALGKLDGQKAGGNSTSGTNYWELLNGQISFTKPGGADQKIDYSGPTTTAKSETAAATMASVSVMGQLINALKEVTGSLNAFSGTYGGGDRAQGAIPSALRENPVALSQAVNSRGLHLGTLTGA